MYDMCMHVCTGTYMPQWMDEEDQWTVLGVGPHLPFWLKQSLLFTAVYQFSRPPDVWGVSYFYLSLCCKISGLIDVWLGLQLFLGSGDLKCSLHWSIYRAPGLVFKNRTHGLRDGSAIKTRLKTKNYCSGPTALWERIELTFSRRMSSCLEVPLSASETSEPRLIPAVLGVRAQPTWALFFFRENVSSYCLNVGHTYWCLAPMPNALGPTNRCRFCTFSLKSVGKCHGVGVSMWLS